METSETGRFSLEKTVQPSQDVVFRELDGEAVLLHLGSGVYFGLNEVGTRIWSLLQQDGSLQKVYDQLLAQYDVSPNQLQADLLALISRMSEKGLLREHLPAAV